MKKMWTLAIVAVAFAAGFAARGVVPGESIAHAQAKGKVYELRIYTVPDDKLAALHARFKNHTMRIFQKHNMSNVAYFKPQDAPKSQNSLIYLISHPSRAAATENWAAFRKDPEWQKVSQESGVGPVTVESIFMDPTDYSPLK
jgi:hypothetical protein